MRASRLTILFSIFFIFLTSPLSLAQQSKRLSLSQLKEQFLALEKIEKDPNTPPDVRELNRNFLEARRVELKEAIEKRINALRLYLSSSEMVLKPEEVQTVQNSIHTLESDLQSLGEGVSKGDSRSLKASTSSLSSPPVSVVSAVAKSDELMPTLVSSSRAQGQCPTDLISSVVIRKSPGQNTLEITLNVPLSLTQKPDVIRDLNILNIPAKHIEISISDGTTNTPLTPVPFQTIRATGRKGIFVNLGDAIPDSATTIKVTLKDLIFDCPSSTSPTSIDTISKSGAISTNETLLAADIEAFNKANKDAAAKRSNDKNFRLGFAAAKGDGENAEGSADVSINQKFFGSNDKTGTLFDLFDQGDFVLQLKKSTAKKDDPRHLTMGFNLRKTFLIASRLKSTDAGVITRSDAAKKRGKGFFRVLMFNQGFNLEGEAFDFKTANFVSDTNLELASIAKKLGSGFYNLNIFGGPEIGRNLSKPDAATTVGATANDLAKVNWITRLKAGGQFTLRLLPSNEGDNWGVELDAAYVNRHLFNSEVFTQETMNNGQTTTKLVTIGQGNRAWRQADLKVYLFGNDKGRYGVKLTYENGQLPPAFTPTKGFQFGVLIESKDDTQGGKPANAQSETAK